MPWSEVSVMDQRREFVRLAMQEGMNRWELCRRFGISPDVGYKWLGRHLRAYRPSGDGWSSVVRRGPNDTLTAAALPGLSIRLGEIR
jgi:transposase-like protein